MENVAITLAKDEALVLFDLLWGLGDEPVVTIRDQADRVALWPLVCLLERELAEPFRAEYGELVAAAKKRITPEE